MKGTAQWTGLDGLRALAVIAVVGNHFGFLGVGAVGGVDLFFVISGFLITTLLLRERDENGFVSLQRFWARRALRLLPALLCAIGVTLLVALVVSSDQRHQTLVGLPWVFLYVGNWIRASGGSDFGLLGHTWSLAVEEQFYIVWPLILLVWIGRVVNRRRAAIVLATLAFVDGAFYNTWATHHWNSTVAFYRTDTRASAILAGCALALFMSQRKGNFVASEQARRTLGLVGLVSLAAFCVICAVDTYSNLISTLVCTGMVTCVVMVPESRLPQVLATGAPHWLGRRSYGIYLYQGIFAAAFVETTRFHGVTHTALNVCCLIATVVLAAASYRWVELPFLRLKSRFSKTTTAPDGQVEPGRTRAAFV